MTNKISVFFYKNVCFSVLISMIFVAIVQLLYQYILFHTFTLLLSVEDKFILNT